MLDPGETWTVSCLKDSSGEFTFPLPQTPTPTTSTLPQIHAQRVVSVRGVSATMGIGFSPEQVDQIERVFTMFVNALPVKAGCLKDVSIAADPDLESIGAYYTNRHRIALDTDRMSDYAIVHELAHHLDDSCGAGVAIGDQVKAAQGLTAPAWWEGSSWVLIPAEHFAETIAKILLGINVDRPGMTIPTETVDLVRTWLELASPAPTAPIAPISPIAPTTPATPATPSGSTTKSTPTTTRPPALATARPTMWIDRTVAMFMAMCRGAPTCSLPVEGKPSWTLSWLDESAHVFRVHVGPNLWFD